MKAVAQILIVILFIFTVLIVLITATLKFIVLNADYWKASFRSDNVYQSLSDTVKSYFSNQVGKEGGSGKDVAILTDLITPENTQDFVDNNLENIVDYLNGKSMELIVYVPINKAPKGLLPKNIASLNNELTIQQLADKFNVTGLDQIPLKNLNRVGDAISFVFIGSVVLLGMLSLLLVWITENTKHFVSTSIAFILSGILVLAMAQGLTYSVTYINQNFSQTDLTQALLIESLPPLLKGIVSIWTYLGLGVSAFGALVLLIRKPGFK